MHPTSVMPTRLKTHTNIKVYTFGKIDTLITYSLLLDRRRFIKLVTWPVQVSNLCYSEPVTHPAFWGASMSIDSRICMLNFSIVAVPRSPCKCQKSLCLSIFHFNIQTIDMNTIAIFFINFVLLGLLSTES
jgi:hypothetical protein